MLANRYEILEEIGAGGMGTVYRAQDIQTETIVALKLLQPDALLFEPNLLERFRREGEALRQLNHPNIVKMLDAFEDGGKHYLVMEHVDGSDLKVYMTENQLAIDEVINFAIDIADALTRAHRLNIIHRDIKPANILIAADRTVLLTDFGVAHFGEAPDLTTERAVVGTLAYVSPESCQGQEADTRADIWSFGVLLYEMLTGQQPFQSKTMAGLISNILSMPTPDLETIVPSVPVALIDLVYRMLAKNPSERIPSVRVVGMELENILHGDTDGFVSPSRIATPEDRTFMAGPRFVTPTSAIKTIKHNLPAQTTPFVGRETELHTLAQLIANPDVRLITILGPGGMGKSRLALELAEKSLTTFNDGVYFVELAAISDEENIVSEIGKALSYPFQQDNRTPLEQIIDFLKNKEILLVMDNFEHLLDGTGIVDDILKGAPQNKFVVTSRQRLNQTGETIFNLGGMEFPDWQLPDDALAYSAVKLFLQSARRVQPSFKLDADDLSHVAAICRSVQGLPLGILLAASWLDMLTLTEIAEEINQSIDFLERDMSDLPERQRSIRAVFDYSLALLTESEQNAFMKLAVFRGGFTRQAVQEIAGANLRILQSLVNKSLLRRNAENGRYEIHELVRQYAEELLENAGLVTETHTAHSTFYAQVVHKLTPRLKNENQTSALNALEADLDNIAASWYWALKQKDATVIQDMWEGVYLYTNARSKFKFGAELFKQAQQIWSIDDHEPLLLASQLAIRFPNAPVPEVFEKGLVIAEKANGLREIACCKRRLGHHLSHTLFDHVRGIALLQESLDIYEEIRDDFYAAYSLDDLGYSYRLDGREDEAIVIIQKSLDLRRKIGDKIGTANSLRNMGGSYGGFASKHMESEMYWGQAKELCYELGDSLGIAWNAFLLSSFWFYQGNFGKAHQLLDEAYPIAHNLNDPIVLGCVQIFRGMLSILENGNLEAGSKLIQEGYPPNSPLDFRSPTALLGQAIISYEKGDKQGLRDAVQQYTQTYAVTMNNEGLMWCSGAVPMLLVEYDRKADAVKMMSQQDHNLSYAMGWVDHWQSYQTLKKQLQTELGDELFQQYWAEGQSLNFDQLVKDIQSLEDTA